VILEIELPYPPSITRYWRRVGPRTLVSREGRRFRQQVVATLAACHVEPLTGPLTVEVEISTPDHRRRDIDNFAKALLDALQHGGVYLDDSQIVQLTLFKRTPVENGKTVVRIRSL
jgi:Holliday junction resolvase RusA-like endonuclease